MCAVSMIFDQYRPVPDDRWTVTVPNIITTDFWVNTAKPKSPLDLFDDLVRIAGELDTALGLEDCEDPRKAKWLDKVRELVKAHEVKKIEERLAK